MGVKAMQTSKTRTLVLTGVFAALAVLLYFLEFPVIPGQAFLKIDLSDLPAAAAAVLLGPAAGIAVELIKNLIDLPVKGFASTMGFGDLMNFIVGVALITPLSLIVRPKLRKTGETGRRRYLLAGVAGGATMVAAGVVGNLLIAPPFFHYFMHVDLTSALLWSEIGGATILNLIKSVVTALLLIPVLALLQSRPFRSVHS